MVEAHGQVDGAARDAARAASVARSAADAQAAADQAVTDDVGAQLSLKGWRPQGSRRNTVLVPISGKLNGEFQVTGTIGDPQGSGQLTLDAALKEIDAGTNRILGK